jgi:hypothetical protein
LGDDIDAPHLKKVRLPGDMTVEDIATWIVDKEYLPQNVQGGSTTWSLVSNRPIAVLAIEWKKPKMLWLAPDSLEEMNFESGVLRAHLHYHGTHNPDVVYEVLNVMSRDGF